MGPWAQHHAIQELHDLVYWLLRYAFYLGTFGVFMFYPPVDQWGALTLGCVVYMSMTHAHRGVYQVAVDYTPREPARAALVATMAVGFWGVMNCGWVVWALYQSLDNVAAWTTQIGVWHRLGTDPAVFLKFFKRLLEHVLRGVHRRLLRGQVAEPHGAPVPVAPAGVPVL